MLQACRWLLGAVAAVERALLLVLLGAIVVSISVQVVSRYFFGRPLIWVEELATYSFIWGTFLGASLALKYDRHVRIETFVGRLPPAGRAVLRAAAGLVMLAALLVMLPPVWANVLIQMRRTTIALPVDIPVAWFFSVPLLVAIVLMILTLVYQILAALSAARSGGPIQPCLPPLPPDEEDLETERLLAGTPR